MTRRSPCSFVIALYCLLAVALLCTACASPALVWEKPGNTAEQAGVDTYQCAQEYLIGRYNNQNALPMAMAIYQAQAEADGQYSRCMSARGYVGHPPPK